MKIPDIEVWDPLIRILHWLLVLAFAVAYVTEGEPEFLHVWSGYLIVAIVALRLIWGFIGPEYARFIGFVRPASEVMRYLKDLVMLRSRRYVGHSPAGGAMIVALLLSLTATAFTGMAVLADEENEGPLAHWLGQSGDSSIATTDDARRNGSSHVHRDDERESVWTEVHEFFANLTLVLVLAHIAGVLVASLAHRENLIRAMLTGRKRAIEPAESSERR